MSKPRVQFGTIDHDTGTRWMRNVYSTTKCAECGAALSYGARVLYRARLRRAACELCGKKIADELVEARRAKTAAAEAETRRLREEYDLMNRHRRSPLLRRMRELEALNG